MAPALDIKLEIALDNNNETREQIRYFPGDIIEGKIFLTANQSFTLKHFRLAWTGRIQVQPIETNKESRIYFDECWKLSPHLIKSPIKAFKKEINNRSRGRSFLSSTSASVNSKGRHIPYYYTQLIPLSEVTVPEPKIELQKNKPLGLAFKVRVPNDRPLPSSTQSACLPNRVIYLLEAFINGNCDDTKDTDDEEEEDKDDDNATDDKSRRKGPVFFAQQVVPVFEPILTRTTEMTMPFRAEQMYVVSPFSDLQNEFTAAMRVTIPCRGSEPGISIPVSITIWNNMEFARRRGISISLLRVNMALANGRAYASESENIHSVVTDLIITASETNANEKVQTVHAILPIPKGTIPTITLETSQLLSVNYFIRVQAFAQEGTYTTPDGRKSQFMTIDLPFIVGTLHSLTTPALSVISSGISTYTNTTASSSSQSSVPTPTSPTFGLFNVTPSPTSTTHQQLLHNLPSINNNNAVISNDNNHNILRKVSTGSARTTISSAPSNYTTATTGSNSSTTSSSSSSAATSFSTLQNMSEHIENLKKKKKRRNVFNKLRMYASGNSGSASTDGLSKQAFVMNKCLEYQSTALLQQLTVNTSMTKKAFPQKLSLETMEEASDEVEENKREQNINYHKPGGGFQGGVFNLFPDDDFTDTEEEEENEDEDNDQLSVSLEACLDRKKEDAGKVISDASEEPSRPPIVFYPFLDSDKDSDTDDDKNASFEEKSKNLITAFKTISISDEKGNSLVYHADNREYSKPNEYDNHKPNSKEAGCSNHSDSNESEDDLLTFLAKKELIKKHEMLS